MSTRRLVEQVARHARRVTEERWRRGGPRLPGWEWSHEVVQDMLRDQFARQGAAPHKIRRRMDAAGRTAPVRGCRLVEGSPAGVPTTLVVPPNRTERYIVYLHGGGYLFGSPASHRHLLVSLARASRATVVALDYRLAPEHACPAAIDDVVAVWRWMLARGIDPDRVTLAGDSAGGGLTLSSMIAMRDADLPRPGRAVLLSPWTDLAITGESVHTLGEHDYLSGPEILDETAAMYAGDLDRRDQRVSPLYAEDLTELPPTLILTGGIERLLDDSTRMADRLDSAGNDVRLHIEPYGVHVYPLFNMVSRDGRDGVRRFAAFASGDARG